MQEEEDAVNPPSPLLSLSSSYSHPKTEDYYMFMSQQTPYVHAEEPVLRGTPGLWIHAPINT